MMAQESGAPCKIGSKRNPKAAMPIERSIQSDDLS